MKVFIFTEAGSDYGYGHLVRCLSFIEYFEDHNISYQVFCEGNNVDEMLFNSNYLIVDWKNLSYLEELKKAHLCIVDSYTANREIYSSISNLCNKMIVMDDYNRIEYPSISIIVNPSLTANTLHYPDKYSGYLFGPEYQLLRKIFRYNSSREIKSNIENVFITMGGSSLSHFSIDVLRIIYPIIKDFRIILLYDGDLEEFKSYSNITQVKCINSNEVFRLLNEVDLAVVSSGQILNELAVVGTPTIAIKLVENQDGNLKSWEKAGFISYAGNINDDKLSSNLNSLVENYKKKGIRHERSLIGKSCIDGRGVERILTYIGLVSNNSI